MKLKEEQTGRTDIYNGRVITLHVDDVMLENGKSAKREVIDHPGGVSVALLTDNDEILFVRQFRYPYGEIVLELPAGKLEKGEDTFEAVKREQKEETGTVSEKYIKIGDVYPSPGYTGEVIRLWAARVSHEGEMDLDEDEFLEVLRIPLDEAVKMVMTGEIKDAKTQIGVLKVKLLKDSSEL